MKSIAWMTTEDLASRPHDCEMALASARSAAHAFWNQKDHRQHKPRSQHRQFRTTILKIKLYFNLHQNHSGQNLPSWPTNINTQPLLSKCLRISQTFSSKKAKANQQLDTSTNPFVFDTIQTDGLKPNASADITLLPTKQPIDVSFVVDVTSNKKFVGLPKIQPSTATSTTFDTNNIRPTFQKLNKKLNIFQDIVKTTLSLT